MKNIGLAAVFFGCICWGGTIDSPQILMSWSGGNNGSGGVSLSFSNATAGGYSYSATACFDLYCPGQSVPGAGPTYPVNDPLTMRLTGLTLTCLPNANGTPCDQVSIYSDFRFNEVDPAHTTVPVTLTIDGTAPAGKVIFLSSTEESCPLPGDPPGCSSAAVIGQSVTADSNGAFSGVFNAGPLALKGHSAGFKVSLGITILGGLQAGESLSMPSSMNLIYGSPVPEPAAWSIVAAGIGALIMLRKRSAGRMNRR